MLAPAGHTLSHMRHECHAISVYSLPQSFRLVLLAVNGFADDIAFSPARPEPPNHVRAYLHSPPVHRVIVGEWIRKRNVDKWEEEVTLKNEHFCLFITCVCVCVCVNCKQSNRDTCALMLCVLKLLTYYSYLDMALSDHLFLTFGFVLSDLDWTEHNTTQGKSSKEREFFRKSTETQKNSSSQSKQWCMHLNGILASGIMEAYAGSRRDRIAVATDGLNREQIKSIPAQQPPQTIESIPPPHNGR